MSQTDLEPQRVLVLSVDIEPAIYSALLYPRLQHEGSTPFSSATHRNWALRAAMYLQLSAPALRPLCQIRLLDIAMHFEDLRRSWCVLRTASQLASMFVCFELHISFVLSQSLLALSKRVKLVGHLTLRLSSDAGAHDIHVDILPRSRFEDCVATGKH